MSLDVQSKTIGNHEYRVTQLDAVKGRRVITRLAKLLAPAISETASAVDTGGKRDAADLSLDKLAKVFERGLTAVSPEDVDFFCDSFAPSTDVVMADGKAPKLSNIFAIHFAGNYTAMFQWLLFCVEVNFGNFFESLGLRRMPLPPPTESK